MIEETKLSKLGKGYIPPCCFAKDQHQELVSSICLDKKCRKFFVAECIDCSSEVPHSHIGSQANLKKVIEQLVDETRRAQKMVQADEFQDYEFKKFLELAEVMRELSQKCGEAADRIGEFASEYAYLNVSSKFEVRKRVEEILLNPNIDALRDNLAKIKKFVQVDQKSQKIAVPDVKMEVDYDHHRSLMQHQKDLHNKIVDIQLEINSLLRQTETLDKLPVANESAKTPSQTSKIPGVLKNNTDVKWNFLASQLYNSKQLRMENYNTVISGSGEQHQLAISSQSFTKGLHYFYLQIESIDDRHKNGCFSIGVIRQKDCLQKTPQDKNGCYKCLFCSRWHDQMIIQGKRLPIGDFRDLLRKGVVLKVFLHIEKGLFEVYAPGGETYYRANPSKFTIEDNEWCFALWWYNSTCKVRLIRSD